MGWRAFRNGLQQIHLWVGLIFSVPFVLIGLSGSIIVAMQWAPDFMLPAATATGDIQPMTRIIEAARSAASGAGGITAITMPQSAGEPAQVQFGLAPGQRPPPGVNNQNAGSTYYIDPVSLKVLGSAERRRASDFNRMITTMHVALMFPGSYGLQFVGFMGICMVLFGISGLVLWWPRKGQWRLAFGVKRGARGWRLNRDLHGAVGFWSLLVFLIISISGVDLAFPLTFQTAFGMLFSLKNGTHDGVVDAATLASIPDKTALTPDDAAKLALSAVPNARVLSVQLPPRNSGGIYMVSLSPLPYGDGAPQISAFVGPGPEVFSIVDPRTYAAGKRILVWLRVMHYGFGLGVVWKLLVFLSGFLPLLFVITGLFMWQTKRAQRIVIDAPVGAIAAAE